MNVLFLSTATSMAVVVVRCSCLLTHSSNSRRPPQSDQLFIKSSLPGQSPHSYIIFYFILQNSLSFFPRNIDCNVDWMLTDSFQVTFNCFFWLFLSCWSFCNGLAGFSLLFYVVTLYVEKIKLKLTRISIYFLSKS